MAEAKVGPMGLQCAKLQRDDLEHCWQSLQETSRGHSKTGTVPTTNCFKDEKAHKSWERKKHRRKTTMLRLICDIRKFVFQQQNTQKIDVLLGVWAVDTPCVRWVWVWRVMCKICFNNYVSLHSVVRGPTLASMF